LSVLCISNQKFRTTHPDNAVTLSTWFLESDLCLGVLESSVEIGV
jgi:hypothetical protein